ncbi:MAG: hypothetical protein ACRC9L_00120 [Brevinema sp.]
MKFSIVVFFLLLSSCSTQNTALKNEWIANISDQPLHGTGFNTSQVSAIEVDSSSGDIFADGKVYRFNEARSAVSAIYTMQMGTYVGLLLTDSGLKTAKYTDAVSTPSQGKNNLDFNSPTYTLATFVSN